MIISIDGTIGSGKTTLASLLALHFKGTDFKYSPPDYDEETSHINGFVREFYEQRDSLKKLVKDYDKKGYDSKIFLLHNLIRNMLIKSSDTDGYVFVDSFWDPFWHFESKYYDDFYPIIHQCIPLPDISFFLGVSAKRSIIRASMRDPQTDHTADADRIQKKLDAFTKWAKDNIPNFYVLQANRPIDKVLENGINIIKEHNG